MSADHSRLRRQFREKHGEFVDHNSWMVFADGARMEASPYGQMEEPPTDPLELAKRLRLFWKVKCEQAVAAFDRLKHVLRQGEPIAETVNGVFVGNDPVGRLQQLRDEVKECQKRLEIAELKVQLASPKQIKRAKSDAAWLERQNRFRSRVDEINI